MSVILTISIAVLSIDVASAKVIFTDDFEGSALGSMWLVDHAQQEVGDDKPVWAQEDGVLKQTNPQPGDPTYAIITGLDLPDHFGIQAMVRIDDWQDNGRSRAGLGVWQNESNSYNGYAWLIHNNLTENNMSFLNDHRAWSQQVISFPTEIGKWFWTKMFIDETNLYGKVWAVGEQEPAEWSIEVPYGDLGFGRSPTKLTGLNGGAGGPAGAGHSTVSFDNVIVFDDFNDRGLESALSAAPAAGAGIAVLEAGHIEDFTEKETVTIAGATSTLTDYQVKITVPFASGMRSDYGDLRFGDEGGTFFSYWIESFTDSEAIVWVKVPSIPPEGATVYVYYGNPSATSASSGTETFEFFDDFDGTSLDTGRWASDGTPVVEDGAVNLNDAGDLIQTTSSFSSSYRIHGRVYTGSPDNFFCVLGFGGHDPAGEWQFIDADGAYFYWEFGAQAKYMVHSGGSGDRPWISPYPADEWHVWELYLDDALRTANGVIDGSSFASSTAPSAISSTRNIFFGRHQNAPGVADFKADWIFVRKHAVTLEIGDIGVFQAIESGDVIQTETGTITTIAGTGERTFGGDGGLAIEASISFPQGVFVDVQGNMFIADAGNGRIRRIDSQTGIITTIAGNGASGFGGMDGPATQATIDNPLDVFVDTEDHVYFTGGRNDVYRIDAQTGIISVISIAGQIDAIEVQSSGTRSTLGTLDGLFLDAERNIYLSDKHNHRIWRVDAQTDSITGIAGTAGYSGFWGDGGPAVEAGLKAPHGLFVDAAGNIFIADRGNLRIRKIDAQTGIITTVAGNGERGFSGDNGPALQASIYFPNDVFVDAGGNLFISDDGNHRIRRVDAQTGIINTVVGREPSDSNEGTYSGDDGPAIQAHLNKPRRIFIDSSGNLFIADQYNHRIRKVKTLAEPTTLEVGVFAPEETTNTPEETTSLLLEKTKIAFSSDRDGNFDIYVMNTDGSNPVRLTSHPAHDTGPSWSPDGTKIAFQSQRDDNWEIYTMNADGTNQVRLTNRSSADSQPSWSPDGTKIAFISNRNGSNGEIYVMNVDGTNPVRLTNSSAWEGGPNWSPDGSKIIFALDSGGNEEIFVMNADGTNSVRLTEQAGNDVIPSWSPDGSKITFTSTRDGNAEIYVMNADGTNPVRLTNQTGDDIISSWSPDGSKIAFQSRRDPPSQGDIYVMNADGTNPVRLFNHSAVDSKPAWSPFLEESIASEDPATTPSDPETPATSAISTTSLTDGATNITPTALEVDGVAFTFTEAIDPNKLRVGVSGGAWTSSWSADGTRLTIKPADIFALAFSTSYEVELTSVEGTDGTTFQDVSLSFTTAAASQISLWAGDTNNDGVVDAKDVIPIGVFWNASGQARTDRSTDWQEQETLSWISSRATRADANGDGRINQSDIDPIVDNWNLTRDGAGKSPAPRAKALRQLLAALENTDSSGPFGALKAYVAAQQGAPDAYELTPSRPNPFNASTLFELHLPASGSARLTIYNIRGQVVRSLYSGYLPAGVHSFTWDGRDEKGRSLSTGVYLYQVRTDEFRAVRRMALIR